MASYIDFYILYVIQYINNPIHRTLSLNNAVTRRLLTLVKKIREWMIRCVKDKTDHRGALLPTRIRFKFQSAQ